MVVKLSATPRLRAELANLARGRAVVVDYYASAWCGVVLGDITAHFVSDHEAESRRGGLTFSSCRVWSVGAVS